MRIYAFSHTIGELLKDGKIYVIPVFQRSFAWDDQQVLDFWEDIIAVYEGKTDGHFLGSMVFTEHEGGGNKIKILDGQQRLATILLFLAALRDTLELKPTLENAMKRIEAINRILYVTDEVTLLESPKLILNKEDRIFFEKIIVKGTIPKVKYSSHKLIKKAYETLMRKIKERVEKEGEHFVQGILDVIMNKLLVIRIQVDSDINAHIIFETLNDRGLDLSVADLVKNYLFSIAGEYLDIAIERWKEIVDNVGDHNVSKFLRHFWISNFELIRKEDLYKKLKSSVNPSNVRSFLEDLSRESLIYLNLRVPSHEFWGNASIENLLEELSILKVEQAYVLLLAAYQRYYPGQKEKFHTLLRNIINFTFRFFTICGLNPSEMERLYSELAIKIRNNEIDIENIIDKLKSRAPGDEFFEKHFKEKEIKNSKLAKYILIKINNYLLKKMGKRELAVDIRRVNLEHIIPKNPDKEWLEFFREKGIENWREMIHRLGNMTILLKEYNRKIANKFFTKKRKMYEKSALPLNEKLKTYDEFGPTQIEERADEMFKIAKVIWKL